MITKRNKPVPVGGKDEWFHSGVFGIRNAFDNKMSPDTVRSIETYSYVPRFGVYWFNPWYDGVIYTKARNREELTEKIRLIESCL